MKITCGIVHLRRLRIGSPNWISYQGQVNGDEKYEYATFLQISTVPKKDQSITILVRERLTGTADSQYISFHSVTYIYYPDRKSVHLLNTVTKI